MAHSAQETQRQLIACALEVLADTGFALAGSGAIREHGMTQRPTNDIDLFTIMQASTRFPHAVDSLIEHLTANDYDVTIERVSPSFAQLSVTPPHGVPLSVDLAIDWRAHTPVRLDVGPVLDIEDAVGNKLCALYSRSYPPRLSRRRCDPLHRNDQRCAPHRAPSGTRRRLRRRILYGVSARSTQYQSDTSCGLRHQCLAAPYNPTTFPRLGRRHRQSMQRIAAKTA